jgi:DNA-binding GntR family transcriptional regulator
LAPSNSTSTGHTSIPRRRSRQRVAAIETEDSQVSSTDQVVDHVISSILAGRLVPGQRLLESDLARTLRVSRGPVREAYRRLDALGAITRAMHRGACVRAVTRTELTDFLTAIEPLVGFIAYLAAERVSRLGQIGDLGRIEELLQPYRDRVEDPSDLLGQRRHFYDALIEIGGNTQLPSLLPSVRVHLLRLQVHSYLESEERKRHLDEYANVAQAVLAGDPQEAERVMRAHIRRFREDTTTLPDAAFPRPSDDA